MMTSVRSDPARAEARGDLPKPGRYRHFKGAEYELLSVAQHTETKELFVVYRAVEDPSATWVRPLEMFAGYVDRPEGRLPRFLPMDSQVSRAAAA